MYMYVYKYKYICKYIFIDYVSIIIYVGKNIPNLWW